MTLARSGSSEPVSADPIKSVCLLASGVGKIGSGESRFVINLAKGLKRLGIEVDICVLSANLEIVAHLEAQGIRVHSDSESGKRSHIELDAMTRFGSAGRRLAKLAHSTTDSEWYVVVTDLALEFASLMEVGKKAYISNGDWGLLYSAKNFYNDHRLLRSFLSLDMAGKIRRNARLASSFDVRLGNSEFTRELMAFLYGIPFSGVVNPPIDMDAFAARPTAVATESYALALVGNNRDPAIPTLSKLASVFSLHVVGGGVEIPGAINLGTVADDELIKQYSGASFLVYPMVQEYFGYAVLESLACGTPALCYRSGGPSEQLTGGRCGWLVDSEAEFVSTARRLFREGYEPQFRANARARASQFSIDAMARLLLTELNRGYSSSSTS